MRISRVVICAAMLAAVATSASGQDLEIHPVKIDVILADPPAAAKGWLRLVPSKDLAITLLAADLKTTAGETIPRNAISLPGEATLKKAQPKDLLIQIDGIRKAGIYEGAFELYAPDTKGQDSAPLKLTASVTVTVVATPKLALLGTQPIVWTIVHCTNPVTCLFVDTFLPGPMRNGTKTLHVEDQRDATTEIAGTLLTPTGNGTEAKAIVNAERDGKPPSGNKFTATATFIRADVIPGVYPAIVELKPKDRGDALSQPITVDIRVGPVIALLAILAGVLVGRLGQVLATPLFQFQSGLLSRIFQIRREVEQLADPVLQPLILERLKNAMNHIELAGAVDASITADVEAIAAQTVASQRFDGFVALLPRVPDAVQRGELEKRARDIRALLTNAQVKDAEAQLATAVADAESAIGGPPVARSLAFPRGFAVAQGTAPAAKDKSSPVVGALRFLAGTRGPVPVLAKYAMARPALFLILLVVLCLTGFNTLYVKAPAGFGSGGLFDELGLFMWGLTADVAQGTLQRLPK